VAFRRQPHSPTGALGGLADGPLPPLLVGRG